MKSKIVSCLCVAALLGTALPARAAETQNPTEVAVDVVIVRPVCFAATVVGSACFVLALPFAAISKSIKPTADALVVKPAKATFERQLGDMDSLSD